MSIGNYAIHDGPFSWPLANQPMIPGFHAGRTVRARISWRRFGRENAVEVVNELLYY
jgi:hypothetical protein